MNGLAGEKDNSTTGRPEATPDRGRVFVLSGPTAVGKGTVVRRLRQIHPELFVSISATTRPPRTGEVDGTDYYFVTGKDFDKLIAEDGLLEWATVHNSNRYGTPRKPVEEALNQGKTALLEIDLQGARQVRKTLPEAKHIFLAPPSWDELVHRLQKRGTESAEQQAVRLQTASQELAAEGEFDYVVVNTTVEDTVKKLVELIGL